jgi:hypothetical protein
MKELKTEFKNEDAVKLLNYFISCKEMRSKTENKNESGITIGVLPKTEKIVVK